MPKGKGYTGSKSSPKPKVKRTMGKSKGKSHGRKKRK